MEATSSIFVRQAFACANSEDDEITGARALDPFRDGTRLQRELEADAKMAELRERMADPSHPLGPVRCKQTAVIYLLRDCPFSGLGREEIADGLGCSVRTVDYAHAKVRADGDGYVERPHELSSERACRGQMPLERAILHVAPSNDVAETDLHGGAQPLLFSPASPDLSPSLWRTDLTAEENTPPPGDLSARAKQYGCAAYASEFEAGRRKKFRISYAPRPVPSVMAREQATRTRFEPDPVALPPTTLEAVSARVDALTFARITNALRHPDCHVDPAATDRAAQCFAQHDAAELAAKKNPAGYLVGLVRAALRGEDLSDRTIRAAELAADAWTFRPKDARTHWAELEPPDGCAPLPGIGLEVPPAPVVLSTLERLQAAERKRRLANLDPVAPPRAPDRKRTAEFLAGMSPEVRAAFERGPP